MLTCFIFQAKEYLANPDAFAVAAPPVVAEAAPVADAPKPQEAAEEKEDSDEDMVRVQLCPSKACLRLIVLVIVGFWSVRLTCVMFLEISKHSSSSGCLRERYERFHLCYVTSGADACAYELTLLRNQLPSVQRVAFKLSSTPSSEL
jgi:hypothetical protein